MPVFVALLRGINVGGTGKLPMKELVGLLEAIGAADVRTYIQSGNAVFRHDREDTGGLESDLADAIEAAQGFRPRVLVVAAADYLAVLEGNPFPEALENAKSLHLFFLDGPAVAARSDDIDRLKAESESWRLDERVFWLHAPDGIGRSRLAARAERLLGVSATARNWRTATAIRDMIAAAK